MMLVEFKAAGLPANQQMRAWIEFRAGELFAGTQEIPIARYVDSYWVSNGMRYSSIECRCFLNFRLEDPDSVAPLIVGPRPLLRVRSRYLFAGREHLATFDATVGLWIARHRKFRAVTIRVFPAA
jgi:hypothetical protein